MASLPQYSSLFSCLHDEAGPIGCLGRGAHYSVMRSVEWLDVTRHPLAQPEMHDFAIIWDEDHDVRVIEAVERIYMAGLLSPVLFIGERKGGLTVIVDARFYYNCAEAVREAYLCAVRSIARELDDPWPADLGSFDLAPEASNGRWQKTVPLGLISDEFHRVSTYLASIDSLWRLGSKPFVPSRAVA